MSTPICQLMVAGLFLVLLSPTRAEVGDDVSASVRAVKIAEANGVPAAEAKSIGEALHRAFGPSSDKKALMDEAVRLAKADPKKAPAIAAASTAFVPLPGYAMKVAVAAAKNVRSQAPKVAAAVAAVWPSFAPLIAGRVARTVPSATMRITRWVAYAVPESVEGTTYPQRAAQLESTVISSVSLINAWGVYGAADRGAKDAAREGRYRLN